MITLHSPPFGCSCPLFFSAHGVYSSQKRDSEFGMSTTTSCSSSKSALCGLPNRSPRSRPSHPAHALHGGSWHLRNGRRWARQLRACSQSGSQRACRMRTRPRAIRPPPAVAGVGNSPLHTFRRRGRRHRRRRHRWLCRRLLRRRSGGRGPRGRAAGSPARPAPRSSRRRPVPTSPIAT